MVLRWLKDGTEVRALARDSAVSQATAYRYLHEPLEVIAQRSPDITDILDRLRRRGEPFAPGRHPGAHRPGRSPHPGRQPSVVLR